MSVKLNTRNAFTLIELLLVIALMGVMATLAVGAYSAVTRGMAERGALAAARALADAAIQRAQIDRTKTYVFLYNEVTRVESDTAVGVAQGLAVAVRPCGRVTMVDGDSLYDEFDDLERAYKSLDESIAKSGSAEASVMRLYNITQKDCADVEEGVYPAEITDNDLETSTTEKPEGDSVTWTVYGFKRKSGSTFKVGDAYGQEFAVTRLPAGFTFSSSVNMSSTSDLGLHQVQVIAVDPDGSTPSFTVYARRADGSFESIGSTGATKDVAQQ